MGIEVSQCELSAIASLRAPYRAEMNCQIIHDSIHARPGWTTEYSLSLDDTLIGYGSVAIAGPWRRNHSLYEFYVLPEHRGRLLEAFESLLSVTGVKRIETQTNDLLLTTMLHTYASRVVTESILFEDGGATDFRPSGAAVRKALPGDAEALRAAGLDNGAECLLRWHGEVAGAGGVLYHYNKPYGDVYMAIAEPYRRKGMGAYLVQELKAACRAGGSVPAARCRVNNVASRRTLQKAGFVPCGNLVVGRIRA